MSAMAAMRPHRFRYLALRAQSSYRKVRCQGRPHGGKCDIAGRGNAWTAALSALGVTGYKPAARMAVDDNDERGPWMKVQAGARFCQRIPASSSSIRAKSKVRAIFDER